MVERKLKKVRRKRTANFQSQIIDKRKDKKVPRYNKDFLNTYIRMFQLGMSGDLNWSWDRELTELHCYIICNGSHHGGTGKSRFSEKQIKCKVKNILVKILPKYLELDHELIHSIDFFTSFIAIFYKYEKYHE
jgi:hypothetical protein